MSNIFTLVSILAVLGSCSKEAERTDPRGYKYTASPEEISLAIT